MQYAGHRRNGKRRVSPGSFFILPHFATDSAFAISWFRIQACIRTVALLEVLRCNRTAMSLSVRVVSWRKRVAIASLAGSLLRLATKCSVFLTCCRFWSLTWALFHVPRCSRAAINLVGQAGQNGAFGAVDIGRTGSLRYDRVVRT